MAVSTSFSGGQRPHDRGRSAERPSRLAARGWKDVLVRLKGRMKQDDVPLLAAGVAFYALLALVPTLVALVSIYGLVADPAEIEPNVEDALTAAPTEVRELVQSQLSSIVEGSASGLQVGALVGLAVALWSASAGMKNLMSAINRAYHERETRKFLKLRGTALALTLGLLVFGAVGLGAMLVPRALPDDGAAGTLGTVLTIVRWPLAAVLVMLGLGIVYHYAADRVPPRWRWASAGAVLATVVFLVASVGFSFYAANFGSYNETYGALGAVVVVMLWLWIGAYAVIAGAELNSEMERQTAADTTTGPPEPLGARGAYAADTIGESTAPDDGAQ